MSSIRIEATVHYFVFCPIMQGIRRPYSEYIVHQYAHCQCIPRKPYADAITRISRYFITTQDIASIFKPIGDVT